MSRGTLSGRDRHGPAEVRRARRLQQEVGAALFRTARTSSQQPPGALVVAGRQYTGLSWMRSASVEFSVFFKRGLTSSGRMTSNGECLHSRTPGRKPNVTPLSCWHTGLSVFSSAGGCGCSPARPGRSSKVLSGQEDQPSKHLHFSIARLHILCFPATLFFANKRSLASRISEEVARLSGAGVMMYAAAGSVG